MKITDTHKESYINSKTIKKRFLGSSKVNKFEEIFAYIIVNFKDKLEAFSNLLCIGMLIGRFEYKYAKEHQLDKKTINMFFTDDYYIVYYNDIGIMSGSAGYAIVESKTDEIVDIEITIRS